MGGTCTDELCELFHGDDLEQLFDVRQALAARGIDAQVWGDWAGRGGARPHVMRLMVERRDLVYARWVAYAAGVDAWPDDAGSTEAGDAEAGNADAGDPRPARATGARRPLSRAG